MDPTFHTLIVGAGPIGSAAARHLSLATPDVGLVGPAEPEDFRDHTGVWSGHYDQGRMGHILETPFLAALLASRSIRRFDALTRDTGISFTTPKPSLTVVPAPARDADPAEPDQDWFNLRWLRANAADLGVPVEDLDEAELQRRFPQMRFAPDHIGLVQNDAMLINPRRFVAAQLAAAQAQGVTRHFDEVVGVHPGPGHVEIRTRGGDVLRAEHVLLAAGAYINAAGLAPRRLAFSTYGATVTLVQVADPVASDFPATMYLKVTAENPFAGIIASPLEYPDGNWYIKGSGASLFEVPLRTTDEIAAWVRTGGLASDREPFLQVLRELLPEVELGKVETRPCLVTINDSGEPYIDFVADKIAVATEGERGVMGGDEIGRLAARLLLAGRWDDSLPAAAFAARYEAAAEPTA